MDTQQDTTTARIALVSFNSLGDSLIYYMLAENLRQHGYDMTLYGDIAYQLRAWMPQLKVMPYPDFDDLDRELSQYHHVIISPPNVLRKRLQGEYLEHVKKQWQLLCQKAPATWSCDHLKHSLQRQLPDVIFSQIAPLLDCGPSIRFRKFKDGSSLVDVAVTFMHEKLKLAQATGDVRVFPPSHLVYRKYSKRIVMSPDSAWPEKKDWTPLSFIKTARLLQQLGYQPVFTVAPASYQKWDAILKGEFEHAKFTDLNELASFVYESGALIGNDSGGGHLASILRIPVVTIYRKRNRQFCWRPAWGSGSVVIPRFILPWFNGGGIWRPFIRPEDVLVALTSLLDNQGTIFTNGKAS